jgi:hypothetical protein
MTQLCGSVLEPTLVAPWLRSSCAELTPADISAMTANYVRLLDGYRLDHPAFPREALLQFTELGPYWTRLVMEAEELYEAGAEGFDAALDEIMATIQVDMEEDHLIPYSKHRHYDTLMCFKAEYDGAVWRRDPADLVFQMCDYDYLAHRRAALEAACAAGCSGLWIY